MAWEAALYRRTRLGVYRHCMDLVEANAEFAPLWERCCMAAYATIGPPLARCFGGDTASAWRNADAIIADIQAVSSLSSREIVRLLRQYVKIKLEGRDHLPFDEAQAEIYEQAFYPLVTHFTFALQPSAAARLKFIRQVIEQMTDGPATFADLGCGSGLILSEVLKQKRSWVGHGLDISHAAIAYAGRLAAHKRVNERAYFCAADIARLPYEDDSLDLVIASEVIEHLPEPQRVLSEIARVLRPGGQLILTMPVESHTPAHLHTLNNAAEFYKLCERAELSVKRLKPKWHFGFGDDRKHLFALVQKPVWSNQDQLHMDVAVQETFRAFASS